MGRGRRTDPRLLPSGRPPCRWREEYLADACAAHDAAWLRALADAVGPAKAAALAVDAARAAGREEGRRIKEGLWPPRTRREGARFLLTAWHLYRPPGLEADVLVSDFGFEIVVTRCRAAEDAAAAGVLLPEACACLERILGWAEGLGVTVDAETDREKRHSGSLHSLRVTVRSAAEAARLRRTASQGAQAGAR